MKSACTTDRPLTRANRRAAIRARHRRAAISAAASAVVCGQQAPSCTLTTSNCRSKNSNRFHHRNQQYSVIALTDGTGAIEKRYAYSAYGEPVFTNASGTVLADSAKDNRYTYTGREWDKELSLYHFRARMYDAESGRFCGRDPIGYASSINMKEFVDSAPTWRIDPSGLFTYSEQELDQCEENLKSDIFKGEFAELDCATLLLKRFLNVNAPAGQSCPRECREALQHSGLPPGYCLGDYLAHSGMCPGEGTVSFALSGVHIFNDFPNWNPINWIPTYLHDLSFAFGKVDWTATGSCKVRCDRNKKCDNCCNCTARCSITRTISDTYDFCKKDGSSPNPGKDKMERGNCACALQNAGRGKKFAISCTNQAVPRFQNFESCGKAGPPNQKCGKSIQGSDGEFPIPHS